MVRESRVNSYFKKTLESRANVSCGVVRRRTKLNRARRARATARVSGGACGG